MARSAIGTELWEKIEGPQGFGFIGDDIQYKSDAEVIAIAQVALHQTRKAEGILRRFIAKYATAIR